MECDRANAQAESVYRLRAALMVSTDVGDAVRWACYQNPIFCVALFACVVRKRFEDSDSLAVSHLLQKISGRRSDDLLGFPENEAEKLMLLALDEVGLTASLAAVDVKYPEIATSVVSEIFALWRPEPGEVGKLFGEVNEAVRIARALEPDATEAAAWWFELAMESSPSGGPMPPRFDRAESGSRRDLSGLLVTPGQESLPSVVRIYDEVLEQDPGAVWALAGRAHVHRCLRRDEEALADYGRVLELEPYAAWAVCRRGQLYTEAGRHAEALAEYIRGVELRPLAAWAIGGRARAHLELGHYSDAVADSMRTLEIATGSSWSHYALCLRGEAYLLLKQYDEAQADFTRALGLDQNSVFALDRRGQAFRALGRYEDALADFDRAAVLAPGEAWPLGRRGETYRTMRLYDASVIEFTHALELDPGYEYAVDRRGRAYLEMGRISKALADYEHGIEMNPGAAWPYTGRGQVLVVMDRHQGALAEYDRALELHPSNTAALLARGHLHSLMGS
jgi:tetratricopeptide (TPR) repeat protein